MLRRASQDVVAHLRESFEVEKWENERIKVIDLELASTRAVWERRGAESSVQPLHV